MTTLNARRNQPFRMLRSVHDSISSRDLSSTSKPRFRCTPYNADDGRLLLEGLTNQAGTGVMPEAEIRKPLPLVRQVMPAVADSQRNGPAPVAVP
jgi:hypothetical protein